MGSRFTPSCRASSSLRGPGWASVRTSRNSTADWGVPPAPEGRNQTRASSATGAISQPRGEAGGKARPRRARSPACRGAVSSGLYPNAPRPLRDGPNILLTAAGRDGIVVADAMITVTIDPQVGEYVRIGLEIG